MSALLSQFTNPKYPIVVVQYKRDDYGVGSEQHLHWALIIITKGNSGPCFQAVDRIYRDRPRKQWSAPYMEVNIESTRKCLGGVQVGTVKHRDLDIVKAMLKGYAPVSKFEAWNCRDYVFEMIELLKPGGYIRRDLAPGRMVGIDDLLPDLRLASRNTQGSLEDGRLRAYIKYYYN
ncbi:hypothetical protein JAAARDRAFT_68530 [Jaapia argillacea MUCL 33604]|uniref:Uncharacterized protein n=1 Tax=Jaapia argillacea MUCL 33604 TaxID=933084 RepID=A0A067PW66_9AGAM|nr:hypothetical protein JAAARDRAFT_68530 [Jaapia argillacea MUCL 33604]